MCSVSARALVPAKGCTARAHSSDSTRTYSVNQPTTPTNRTGHLLRQHRPSAAPLTSITAVATDAPSRTNTTEWLAVQPAIRKLGSSQPSPPHDIVGCARGRAAHDHPPPETPNTTDNIAPVEQQTAPASRLAGPLVTTSLSFWGSVRPLPVHIHNSMSQATHNPTRMTADSLHLATTERAVAILTCRMRLASSDKL